jgi:hypothetical protein
MDQKSCNGLARLFYRMPSTTLSEGDEYNDTVLQKLPISPSSIGFDKEDMHHARF